MRENRPSGLAGGGAELNRLSLPRSWLNLPLGTVLTRMQLALRKLRKLLESDG